MQELEKILKEIDEIKVGFDTECRSECDLFDWSCGACVGECDEYIKERAKDIIRKHMNDGWIPVDKNNMPDHEILACDRYDNELIGYLGYNADAEEFVCESDGCIMYQVIAWMEKPEPYRPERSEGE